MTCQAILFDLDGTLLDTLSDLAHSVNEVLSRLGYRTPVEPPPFVGEGIETLIRRALPEVIRYR